MSNSNLLQQCQLGNDYHGNQGLGLVAPPDFRAELAAQVLGDRVADELADHECGLEVYFGVQELELFKRCCPERLAESIHAEVGAKRRRNAVCHEERRPSS